MSRKLPIAGQRARGSSEPVSAGIVRTLWLDAVPVIAVAGSHVSVGADTFVGHLVAALERRGRAHVIESSSKPADETRLFVIIGSHVPRALREPTVHALWERADLLLSDPSAIVAEALVAAL